MLRLAASGAFIAIALIALEAPKQSLAATACAAQGQQERMTVSGKVIQVGVEPLNYQHMVILDSKTNCRVLVLVENNDKPCAYNAQASITIPIAPATSAERNTFGKIDYMDKGQNEMFTCK